MIGMGAFDLARLLGRDAEGLPEDVRCSSSVSSSLRVLNVRSADLLPVKPPDHFLTSGQR
jgi:hypothetical protein